MLNKATRKVFSPVPKDFVTRPNFTGAGSSIVSGYSRGLRSQESASKATSAGNMNKTFLYFMLQKGYISISPRIASFQTSFTVKPSKNR